MTVTIDTTTYDNPNGPAGAKLTVLVLPAYDIVGAVAVAGEAFPRVVFDPSGLYLGDGTFDPYADVQGAVSFQGGAIFLRSSDGATLEVGSGTVSVSVPDADGASLGVGEPNGVNRGKSQVSSQGPIVAGGNNAPAISGGIGTPTIGGEEGDFYFRADPGAPLETIYRCTDAGIAGTAAWAGIV